MFCYYFQPSILQPTRYKDKIRPSLIGNIFVNSLDLKAMSGNLISRISDHMPNFIILEKNISESKKLNIIKRNFRNFNETFFINEVKHVNFDNLYDAQNNIHTKYDIFQNKISRMKLLKNMHLYINKKKHSVLCIVSSTGKSEDNQ